MRLYLPLPDGNQILHCCYGGMKVVVTQTMKMASIRCTILEKRLPLHKDNLSSALMVNILPHMVYLNPLLRK